MTSKGETEQLSGIWSIQEWYLRGKQKHTVKSLSVSVTPELFQEEIKITLCDSVQDATSGFLSHHYMRNFCNLIGLEQWYFSLI